MLAHANATPGVPMIGLLFDLSAPAILDLMSLGVTDFVRAPACPEELRARIVCRNRGKPRSQRTGLDTCEPNPSVLHGRAPLAGYSPSVLVRPRDVATPGPRNVDRLPGALPGVPRSSEAADLAIDAEAFDVRSTDEPFRQAKARIVAGFESAYLRRALSRYSGNVAQAARASCKHRRAFWALMRKHQIDAAHYRIDETFREPSA